MRTTVRVTLLLVMTLASTVLSRAKAQQLRGSDTLEAITKDLLANTSCTSGTLNYLGGGSGTGETAMLNGTQQIAPMSRALSGAACTTAASGAGTAEGMLFGLDGMVVVVDSEQTERCGSSGHVHTARGNTLVNPTRVEVTATTPSNSPLPSYSDLGSDWAAKLRLIYFGLPPGTATAGGNCSSDARRALFNNYKGLFPNGCSTGGTGQSNTCTGIQHAFRRGDASGTTDLMRTLLSAGTAPFCNGTDQLDKDPLRRTCNDAEQVCSADGQLGFVLPIVVPEGDDLDLLYPAAVCPNGRFRSGPAPFNDSTSCFRNPITNANVWPSVFAKCPSPVTVAGGPCLNGFTQDEFGGNQFVGRTTIDARAHNLRVRRGGSASAAGGFAVFANGSEVTAAFYRIHSTLGGKYTFRSTAPLCRLSDSTRQIGCLVQAPNSSCSLGYAGGEAVQQARAEPLALNGVDWTDANIQNLVNGLSPVYPLARKLYVNTFKGFQSVTGAERNLAACFSTPNVINPLLDRYGFTRLPSQDPVCEESCPSGPFGAHCTGNPSPFF